MAGNANGNLTFSLQLEAKRLEMELKALEERAFQLGLDPFSPDRNLKKDLIQRLTGKTPKQIRELAADDSLGGPAFARFKTLVLERLPKTITPLAEDTSSWPIKWDFHERKLCPFVDLQGEDPLLRSVLKLNREPTVLLVRVVCGAQTTERIPVLFNVSASLPQYSASYSAFSYQGLRKAMIGSEFAKLLETRNQELAKTKRNGLPKDVYTDPQVEHLMVFGEQFAVFRAWTKVQNAYFEQVYSTIQLAASALEEAIEEDSGRGLEPLKELLKLVDSEDFNSGFFEEQKFLDLLRAAGLTAELQPAPWMLRDTNDPRSPLLVCNIKWETRPGLNLPEDLPQLVPLHIPEGQPLTKAAARVLAETITALLSAL